MSNHSPRQGPVYESQLEAGAKFGDFAGWSMPLEYAGAGVLAEHEAVRTRVGLFDVSHMGTFTVSGEGAVDALNEVLTNDLRKIGPGQAQYSLLCNDSGGVIDDLFLYVRSDDEVVVVPNAANASIVIGTTERVLESVDVRVADLGAQTAIFAIQGPLAADVMEAVGLPTDLPYLGFVDVDVLGSDGPGADTADCKILVARTGYTGEPGFELLLPADQATQWWLKLADAVTAAGGLLCGLGARDTLRTEMGYPLHGHELSPTISPLEAGLSWAIGWSKTAFPGRRALLAEKEHGTDRTLVGLRFLDRGVPRAEMTVLHESEPIEGMDREVVGRTTSGTFSPTLKTGVALAFVNRGLSVGDAVAVDVRGRACRAEIVKLPFVDSNPRG